MVQVFSVYHGGRMCVRTAEQHVQWRQTQLRFQHGQYPLDNILVEPDDICMLRDKGYFGKPLKFPTVKNYTIQRGVRGRKLTQEERRINRLISRVRSPVERPFAIIKNVFHRDMTRLKRCYRVRVQQMLNCFTFNIYHLFHCSRRGVLA